MPAISLNLVYISYLYLCIMLLYAYNRYHAYVNGHNIKFSTFWILALMFIYCIYAYNVPDFVGHLASIKIIKIFGANASHLEDFYVRIIEFANFDNITFRLIIYIPIFLILYYFATKFTSNKYVFLCCAIMILMNPTANLIRSSLSDYIGYAGILTFYKNRFGIKNIILLSICSVICLYLHKSAFLIFIPFLLSFLPLNKNLIKTYILVFPILAIIGNYIVIKLFQTHFSDSLYNSNETMSNNYILRKVVVSTILFVIWFYALKKMQGLAILRNFNGYIYRFMFFAFIIWTVSILFPVNHFVAERFFSHCLIPLSLFITYFTIHSPNRVRRNLGVLMICYVIIAILDAYYSVYYLSIHLGTEYKFLLS